MKNKRRNRYTEKNKRDREGNNKKRKIQTDLKRKLKIHEKLIIMNVKVK